MREIRFRGKRIDNGEWVYGYYNYHHERHGIITQEHESYNPQVFPESVGQFTGLKDVDNKEIYEGDIIKVQNPYNNEWSSNGAEVVFSTEFVGGWVILNNKQNLNLGTRQKLLKIIGNINENPELLK